MRRRSPEEIQARVARLVPDYLRRRRADVTLLRAALGARDLARVGRIGHDLRGTGSSFGLPELTRIGVALEDAARSADPGAIERSIAALAEALDGAEAAAQRGQTSR
jgi:HPt (histidine-containing phosphotransfer) domain-containing protein